MIGGEVARALGLRVPELVVLNLNDDFGRTEPDEEIQDLLRWSRGLNLGLHFLRGAMTYDPYVNTIGAVEASDIVWLDAFITNIDRTAKNTNMLVWNRETWLIDHGASLYFHYSWSDPQGAALSPFPYVKDHVLLPHAADLEGADLRAHKRLTPGIIADIVTLIPDNWLRWEGSTLTPDQLRDAYCRFLITRLENSDIFLRHAIDARKLLV